MKKVKPGGLSCFQAFFYPGEQFPDQGRNGVDGIGDGKEPRWGQPRILQAGLYGFSGSSDDLFPGKRAKVVGRKIDDHIVEGPNQALPGPKNNGAD